jgi:hypothetical protein
VHLDRRDVVSTILLFVGATLYWVALPHSLGPADESVHLYEAKRVLEGEALYRDVFNFITPGWFYLIAGLFWTFGTTIDTARTTMAVIHGMTTVLVYLSGRRLGVRPWIAWLPSLGYLAICQPAWSIVSQHWLSTLLCAALLFICARPRGGGSTWALRAGAVLGLLIGVQQQRGAFMAAGVGVWLLADNLVQRRYGSAPTSLLKNAVALAIGAVAVVGPILALAVAKAGVGAVWYALVIFPLFNYRNQMRCPWGDVNLMTAGIAPYTFPLVLKYLPLVLLLSATRLLVLWSLRRDPAVVRGLVLLLVFSIASACSIAYFPDFIKISFIAFVFLIAMAENLEWLVAGAPGRAWKEPIGWIVFTALLLASARHLYDNMIRFRAAFPVPHATAFGRVDFPSPDEAELHDQLVTLLARTPSRALYAYPILADLYLTVPADNPTRYGFFFYSDYHTPAEVQEVLDVLATRRLPYIVVFPALLKPGDPIMAYVAREYEALSPSPLAGRVIYRRRAELLSSRASHAFIVPGDRRARPTDEQDLDDAAGRRDHASRRPDHEVAFEEHALRGDRPDVLPAVTIEEDPLPAIRRLGIEVEDDDPARHQAGEAREDRVGERIREVMQRVHHDRRVEPWLVGELLEPRQLEAAPRRSPAPAGEGDVVRVEIDADVLPRHGDAETAAATPEVEHALGRRRGQRRRHLAERAIAVQDDAAVMEQGRSQHAAGTRRHAGRVGYAAARTPRDCVVALPCSSSVASVASRRLSAPLSR